MNLQDRYLNAMNRLAKWRQVLAGWQLGTRLKGDPECDAVRDTAEARLLLRVEVNAQTALLIKKGVFTTEEFQQQAIEEADHFQRALEQKFPGMRATDDGISYDKRAVETMKGWKK